MRYVALLLIILLSSIPGFAQEASVTDYLTKGDEAYKSFDNEQALKFYQEAFKLDSTNCEALWKIARAYVDLGEVSDKKTQKKDYYLAEKFARKAVTNCPYNSMAHLELAIAVGRVALMEGGKKKVKLSKEVKFEAEKALELDPNNDLAHHVLARWHREVATLSGVLKMFAKVLYGGLPPASLDKAVEHFKKAIEINPNYINHHLELGITYEKMKKWKLAKEEYEKVAQLPIQDSDDAAHKKEAAERLKKVMKKL